MNLIAIRPKPGEPYVYVNPETVKCVEQLGLDVKIYFADRHLTIEGADVDSIAGKLSDRTWT